MRGILVALVCGAILAGCNATGAALTPFPAGPAETAPPPTPIPTATPEPTARPYAISVGTFTYTSEAIVGGAIGIDVNATNTGKANEPTLRFQISDIDDYTDIVGCKPACAVTSLFGLYADVPGVKAGKTVKVHIELLATKIGAPRWSVCVYDAAEPGAKQVGCAHFVTVIR